MAESEALDGALALVESLPAGLAYLVLGAGAALENIVPPIPADTFILVGGFIAARGPADVFTVFLAVWAANTSGALLVYRAGYRYGPALFETRAGRWLLRPGQLNRLRRFYHRRGVAAIFLARFLPGLRAVVPAFAGVTRLSFASVAAPVAIASAIWYGTLVRLGALAGDNLDAVLARLGAANRVLLLISGAVVAVAVIAWVLSRRAAPAGSGRDRSMDGATPPR